MSTLREAIQGFHLVRYGTPADQKYLLRPFLDTYDELVINANMVAHARAALTAFLMQHARQKPFFIDPQTHAFQHDISSLESKGEKSSGKIKRSIQNLIEAYGDPIKRAVLEHHRCVLPRDFRDQAVLQQFCQQVMRFQLEAISQEAEKSDTAKYYKFVQGKRGLQKIDFGPTLVIPPYFHMTSSTVDQWISININSAKIGLAGANKTSVGVQIVISKDLMVNNTAQTKLVNAYSELDPAVFLLWIDGFSEHDAARYELNAFAHLLGDLSKHAPVVNLYGGFFSIALQRCGIVKHLAGVCHGLEYGESRDVVPVGGGIPIAKFYYPALHKRLAFRDALRVAQKEGGLKALPSFYKVVCNCDECKQVITKDPMSDFAEYGRSHPVSFMRQNRPIAIEYPLPETKEHCVRHYMWSKSREYSSEVTPAIIMEDMKRTERLAGTLGLESVAYASCWKAILKTEGK